MTKQLTIIALLFFSFLPVFGQTKPEAKPTTKIMHRWPPRDIHLDEISVHQFLEQLKLTPEDSTNMLTIVWTAPADW